MSKHTNVSPGQYQLGGRLHPGDDSSRQDLDKAAASMTEHEREEQTKQRKNEEDYTGD